MDVLVGTGVSVQFLLQGLGGSLVPDPGTATYRLYGQAGTIISGPTVITTGPSDTVVTVPISSGSNTIAGGKDFEKRTVHLTWTSGGKTFSAQQSYRVVPFLNITATAETVRAELGLTEDELPDEAVDLLAAYLVVRDELTGTTLVDALSSGTILETAANQLIAVDAALRLLPSLQTRTLMSVTDGVQKSERFRTPPDLERLSEDLRGKRSALIAAVNETVVDAQALFAVVDRTDPFTGV
jgi:hypothetical protein